MRGNSKPVKTVDLALRQRTEFYYTNVPWEMFYPF